MTDKINTKVDIGVSLKAQLETKAATVGLRYRDYLVSLIDIAAEQDAGYVDVGPTKQTRLALSEMTKEKVKRFAKQANCSQEQWLLNVFQSALEDKD
ncbi:MAG: hypothetical protein GXP14_02220 [Gammaproteobacteria bacterium]|nr:hypothetical protein [Gammaproteobacteria bacterium]